MQALFLNQVAPRSLTGLPESRFVDRMFHTEAIGRAFPDLNFYGIPTRPARTKFRPAPGRRNTLN